MTFGEADDFVSTGSLPSPAQVRGLLDAAYQQFAAHSEGAVSQVYPALARVQPELFGICLAGVSGNTYSIGAAEHPFTIMSVSKPFVFALVCQMIGPDAVRKKIGVNATGHAFNSAAGIDAAIGECCAHHSQVARRDIERALHGVKVHSFQRTSVDLT